MKKPALKSFFTNGWKRGLDTRPGIFAEDDGVSFAEMTNAILTADGDVRTRMPDRKWTGTLGANCQGLIYRDGTFYTFRKRGDSDTRTLDHASNTMLLSFDVPEYTTTWTLIACGVFNDKPYAVIRHTFPSATYPTQTKLHLWDGADGLTSMVGHPTYVMDPSFPSELQVERDFYGATVKNPRYVAWDPVVEVNQGKLYVSGPTGNVHCSAVANARVWSDNEASDIENNGWDYLFVVPDGVPTYYFTIPEKYLRVAANARFGGAEIGGYFTGCPSSYAAWSGAHVDVNIDEMPYSATHWSWQGPSDPVQGDIRGGTRIVSTWATQILRFRVYPRPRVELLSGGLATITGGGTTLDTTACTLRAEGKNYSVDATTLTVPALTAAQAAYLVLQPKSITVGASVDAYEWKVIQTAVGVDPLFSKRQEQRLLVARLDHSGGLVTSIFIAADAKGRCYEYLQNSAWWQAELTKFIDFAGADSQNTYAGFIGTAAQPNADGPVTALQSIKNRMLVSYADSTQLWGVTPILDASALLQVYEFGAQGPAELFNSKVMLNTQQGIRAFNLSGLNYEGLEDVNIGEPIQQYGRVTLSAAGMWSYGNYYIAFGSIAGSETYASKTKLPFNSLVADGFGFFTLVQSDESNTLGWSWNAIPGVTACKWRTFIALDSKLYYVDQDSVVHYLDDEATDFTDAGQTTPIATRCTTHYMHLGQPGVNKRLISAQVACEGQITLQWAQTPWLGGRPMPSGPIMLDVTYGTPRVPLTGTVPALALSFSCQSAEGFQLQNLQVQYVPLGR